MYLSTFAREKKNFYTLKKKFLLRTFSAQTFFCNIFSPTPLNSNTEDLYTSLEQKAYQVGERRRTTCERGLENRALDDMTWVQNGGSQRERGCPYFSC